MKSRNYSRLALMFSLSGTLFAGYLSVYKMFSGVCAFNESCPYVFGYPACWYGFVLFASMSIASSIALVQVSFVEKMRNFIRVVSLCGIAFAGYLVFIEISGRGLVVPSSSPALGFPTCVYGLVFYCILFGISLWPLRGRDTVYTLPK